MNSVISSKSDAIDIVSYIPLVNFVVNRMTPSTWPTFDREDLVSYGTVGLLDAARRYNPERGPFPAFAIPRIRGAVIDALRANDFLPRSVRKDVRRLIEAEGSIFAETGSVPDVALESALGVTHERMVTTQRAARLRVVSIDAPRDDGEGSSNAEQIADEEEGALDHYLKKELLGELAHLVRQLPDRERKIISLHFVEGLTQKEISQVMDLSESRISQLQSRALFRLRAGLQAAA